MVTAPFYHGLIQGFQDVTWRDQVTTRPLGQVEVEISTYQKPRISSHKGTNLISLCHV